MHALVAANACSTVWPVRGLHSRHRWQARRVVVTPLVLVRRLRTPHRTRHSKSSIVVTSLVRSAPAGICKWTWPWAALLNHPRQLETGEWRPRLMRRRAYRSDAITCKAPHAWNDIGWQRRTQTTHSYKYGLRRNQGTSASPGRPAPGSAERRRRAWRAGAVGATRTAAAAAPQRHGAWARWGMGRRMGGGGAHQGIRSTRCRGRHGWAGVAPLRFAAARRRGSSAPVPSHFHG